MKLRKNDIILIFGFLLVAGALWFFLRPGETGAYVVVTQNGEFLARYSLYEDRTEEIHDPEHGYNTLIIENGKAYISDADCGDHTCIHTGKIHRDGERIICLPHKLVIEVIGGDTSAPDASTH